MTRTDSCFLIQYQCVTDRQTEALFQQIQIAGVGRKNSALANYTEGCSVRALV